MVKVTVALLAGLCSLLALHLPPAGRSACPPTGASTVVVVSQTPQLHEMHLSSL